MFINRMNKKYSLKKNYEITKLISKKQSVGNRFYTVYYDCDGCTQVAISISKKICKANKRNYNKRVVKEILRRNFNLIENIKMLIVIKEKSLILKFNDKEKEIKKILTRIRG